jgi:CDP-2,3-bis-(O-geranylgeranyl)-sn-glycerol synthase
MPATIHILFSPEWLLALKLLLLLGVANFVPIVAKKLFHRHWATPLDGGLKLPDGTRLFGPSKTVRGLVLAIGVTALAAPLVALPGTVGAALAALSMTGDLLTSFVKRRLRRAPSSQAPGLDQVPEVLLPLLVLGPVLGLPLLHGAVIVVAFVVLEVVLSRALYYLGVRDEPY